MHPVDRQEYLTLLYNKALLQVVKPMGLCRTVKQVFVSHNPLGIGLDWIVPQLVSRYLASKHYLIQSKFIQKIQFIPLPWSSAQINEYSMACTHHLDGSMLCHHSNTCPCAQNTIQVSLNLDKICRQCQNYANR